MVKFSILMDMLDSREIIAIWSRRQLARDLNVPVERVRGWERQNSLPASYWRELLNKAPERNIDISGDLLIDIAARN